MNVKILNSKVREKQFDNEISMQNIALLCFLIDLLIIVGLYNKVISIAALIIAVIAVFFSEPKSSLYYLVFILPVSPIFKMSPDSISLFSLLIIVAVIKLFMSTINYKYNTIAIISLVLLIGYLFIRSGNGSSIRALNIAVGFLLLFFYTFYLNNKNIDKSHEFKYIVLFFSVGLIISSVIALFSKNIPAINSYIRILQMKIGDDIYFERFSGLQGNPNFYSMDLTIAMSCLMVLYLRKSIKVSFYILMLAISVFGIMTVSKSFMIVLMLFILFYIYLCFKAGFTNGIKNIFMIGFIILAVYLIIDKSTLEVFFFRISSDFDSTKTLSSITTHRSDIWLLYYKDLVSDTFKLIFGNSLNSSYLRAASHNTYLQIIHNMGIVGLLFYLFALTMILINNKKIKRNFINYVPLILFLIRCFAIDLFLFDNIYFYYIMIWMSFNINTNVNRMYPY